MKLNLTTKKIEAETIAINCDVSREQVEDIKDIFGFDHSSSIDSFYIQKEIRIKDNILDNDLIKITDYSKKYYHIDLNLKMWYRVLKISKIYDDKNLKKVVKIIKYYFENRVLSATMIEEELVDALTKEINKEILKNVMKLK